MNPTRKHWQRFACFLLALLFTLLLPASGAAQDGATETPSESSPAEAATEAPTATPIVEASPTPTEEPIETAEPEAQVTEVVTEEPTEETQATVEPEVTPEITPEVTTEPEVTPETTVEPELTPEVTLEPEVTPEVTEEAVVELSAEGLAKFPEALRYFAQLIQDGDLVTARAGLIAMNYLVDAQNRVALQIYPVHGVVPQLIEQQINTWNSRVLEVNGRFVIAHIPLDKVPNLLESDSVASITRPPMARSTGPTLAPMGTTASEGFNMLGLSDWHPSYTGAGVRVGIIDAGFEYDALTFEGLDYKNCLAEIPVAGDNLNHGLFVIQTICDMAPNADVYAYSLGANAFESMATAIYEAIADQIDVLVITAEISDLVPGDGTGLEDGTDDPYEALATARAGGMVIFAAAGNFGQTYTGAGDIAGTGDNRAERYVTFRLNSTAVSAALTPGNEVARINFRASVGDEIFITWNDWAPTGLNSSTIENLEDFAFALYMTNAGGTLMDANPDTPALDPLPDTTDETERASLFDLPRAVLTVPADIDSGVGGCQVTLSTNFDGTCHVALFIYRIKGDSFVTFQAGLSLTRFTWINNQEIVNSDREITGHSGANVQIVTTTGTIARPADSPDVIAVGAVCANENSNMALIPDSSRGMIFGANGTEPLTFPAILNQSNVKPEIVSVSYVSTSLGASVTTSCDDSFAAINSAGGFGGTSAAAAHAAGATAVMLSNPTFRNFFTRDAAGVDAIQNYIQAHSVELPLGNAANGYDYNYGAGLFILGSPDFNPANSLNGTGNADLIAIEGNISQCDPDGNMVGSSIVYVGQGNLNSSQDGTLSNPYLSISHAIKSSVAGDCIVVMPGEYVTPILINTSNVNLYAYRDVTSLGFPATVIRVSGQYMDQFNADNSPDADGAFSNSDGIVFRRNAGIYIDEVDNVYIEGFTFIGAQVSTFASDPAIPDLPAALPRQAIFADETSGLTLAHNDFGQISVDGSTYDSFVATPIILNMGDSALLEQNVFQGNVGGTYATNQMISPVISIISHGTSSNNAAVFKLNYIYNNLATDTALNEAYWPSLVYASDSYLDIVANTFLQNSAGTLIYARTGADEDIRIVSNLFQRNTLSTTGEDSGEIAGALIQTSNELNDLSFINNTVVVNLMTESENPATTTMTERAVLGRGTRDALAAVGTFDFVNNLVYNGTTAQVAAAAAVRSIITATGNTTCNSLAGGANAAVRENWLAAYPTSGTSCNTAMTTLVNGNITTNPLTGSGDPVSYDFMGAILETPKNPLTDPLYYVLGVTNRSGGGSDVYSVGVDASTLDNRDNTNGNAITSELGNGIVLGAEPFDFAANGQVRVWDIDTWADGVPTGPPASTTPPHDVDIGAFEFINLNIVDDFIEIAEGVLIEDTPVVAIDFETSDRLVGGYGNLHFEVTAGPANYGTACGFSTPDTANPGQEFFGVRFGTGTQAETLFYCLAPNFYTDSVHPEPDLPAAYPGNVEIHVRVSDELELTDTTTVLINITEDGIDADPVDADLDIASPFPPEEFVVIADVDQDNVRVRLRPFVDFGNFGFSEQGNALFVDDLTGEYAIDYPFTYSAVTVSSGTIIPGNIVTLDTVAANEVYAEFDLGPAEGEAILTYTVTDERNNVLTMNMTVRAISRIPRVTGLYDDSSFAFDYLGGSWTAVNEPTAVNNTLHTTNGFNAVSGFGFYGTGFTLYMKGQGPTLGGDFDLGIFINSGGTAVTLGDTVAGAIGGEAWTPVPNSTIYQTRLWADNPTDNAQSTLFTCTTDAIRAAGLQLSSTPVDYYAITCNSLRYTAAGAPGYQNEPLSPFTTPQTHLVQITNLSTKRIAVDAFTLLNDAATGTTTDVGFTPGFHDVDELELRDAFGASWLPSPRLVTYSNGMAYVLSSTTDLAAGTATANQMVSFHVYGGTGFALETTQESMQASYSICVTDTTTQRMTCQRFDYLKPAVTPLLYGVYRPFYGLNPARTYRVDILPQAIPANVKFVIDGLVVFDETDVPVSQLTGGVDNGQFESFVYGGAIEDSWTFNAATPTAFESTLSTVAVGLKPGPYVAFETAETADTVYWSYGTVRPSTAAMVCVDRAEGVVAHNAAALPTFTEVNNGNGNCIVVNLLTGDYWQIGLNGSIPVAKTGSVRLTTNTIALREANFRSIWDANDTDNKLTFEIFSIYDTGISVDRMVAISNSSALTAGRYEEYTLNIKYHDDASSAALTTIPSTESAVANTYPNTGFIQVLGAGALRDFGQGVMYTRDRGAVIRFSFTGTGFAPSFRLSPTSEAIEVCWTSGLDATPTAALSGVCQIFDNENRTIVNNGLRPILGLPFGTYTVAIRFLGDNFTPTINRSLFHEMWFDGVVIYNEPLTTGLDALTPLVTGTLYEGSFSRHEEFNNFEYLGSRWISNTTSATTYSARNVDSIVGGEVGATVSFITDNANAIILTRNLAAANTPFLLCATQLPLAYPGTRFCQTIDNSGVGIGNKLTIYLGDETRLAGLVDYLVTITALSSGPVYFDAVQPVEITAPLTEGQYDNNNPNLIYNYGSRNLVLNGDFESTNLGYWSSTQTVSRVGGVMYSGSFAMNVSAVTGQGISQNIVLKTGVTYTVVANVRVTSGVVEMDTEGRCAVDPLTDARVNVYQPLRCTFTAGGDTTMTLSFIASGGAAVFHVDAVSVTQGATWQIVADTTAYGGNRSVSTTHGAEIRFGVQGTGFALGLSSQTSGGRMMVCYQAYDPAAEDLQTIVFNYSTDTCISFENESATIRNDTIRIIEGLAFDTYAVLVRDMEEGDSDLRLPLAIRTSPLSVGQIRLDYVQVFNTTAPVLAHNNPGSGSYNESAANDSAQRFLQLLPENRWGSFNNATFSDGSYVSPTDAAALASRTTAGGAVMLSISSPAATPVRLVFDLKAAALTNSNQVLACVNAVDGIVQMNSTTGLFEVIDNDGTQNCTVITNLTTSRFMVLTPNNLPLLDDGGIQDIIIQPLTAGPFTLDDYQVLFNNTLAAGYYEEGIIADVAALSTTAAPTWTIENNALYSNGSAYVLSNQTDTFTFSFTGTGFSLISALNTTGGDFDITVAGPVNIALHTVTTDFTALAYGSSFSYTGLPSGTYTVTITANAGVGEKVILDAIEIYGSLQTLGSLYDDTEVTVDGTPYLSFGPDNATWALRTGATAPTALNRTLHVSSRAGATFSFQMNDARGLILYYGAGTATELEVCFREVGNPANLDCNTTAITITAGNVEVPTPSTGDWLVSVTNLVPNKTFALDAVQVLEAGLHEGIFDAADLDAMTGGGTPAVVYTEAIFDGATNTILIEGKQNDLDDGGSVSFTMSGVAFSLLFENVTAGVDFTLTGNDGGLLFTEEYPLAGETIPPTGQVAISYAGLHEAAGTERVDVVITITNNSTTALRLKGLHILGGDSSLEISDTSRYENDMPEIRYLPFGSMVNTVISGNRQSGGSEHQGTAYGQMVYLEFAEASAEAGIAYVRQVAPTMSQGVQICYGTLGSGSAIQTLTDARTANQCTNISNRNATLAFQVSEIIETDADCVNGCWVTIRNRFAQPMAFDFARLYDTSSAMTAGFYQDNYPGLNYANGGTGSGINWQPERIALPAASDGFVTQADIDNSLDPDITNTNGAYVWFVMNGTGFSVDFVNDMFSDSVRICYAVGPETTDAAVLTDVLGAGTCQVFDNESRVIKGNAQRSIIGLPDATYTVAIQIMRDNLSPARHSVTASPVRMSIDAVEVYDISWSNLEDLSAGTRYETDFASRNVDNRFAYIGSSWLTLEGTRAASNGGRDVDQVREFGGAIAFRTSNADAMTFYANLAAANTTFRVCATPVDAGFAAIVTTHPSVCQDFSTVGVGMSQAFSFRFHDYFDTAAAAYFVSISTLNDQLGFIDSIVLSDADNLTEGLYEGTDVNLFTDVVFEDYVYNSRMEVNAFWETVNNPTVANQSTVRYEGAFGWHVEGDVGAGIESQPIDLGETSGYFTAIARVKVSAGTVRMRLVEGDSPVSIDEYRLLAPTGGVNNNDWLTLRVDFQLADGHGYEDLRLQLVANSNNSRFDVDDVHFYHGGLWGGVYNRVYSGGSTWRTQTAGSSMYFSFEGTGFEIGTEFGLIGGEMEVCYDTNNNFGDVTDSCFIYQNEATAIALGMSRTVAGLPFGTYYVRIREDEDGRSTVRLRLNASRLLANAFGKLSIDYVRIFGANNVIVTPPSFFNENATDINGNPYLQLYPSQDWGSVAAPVTAGFSGNSYRAVVNNLGRVTTLEAGQSAVLYVDVPDAAGTTVVLYTGPINPAASLQYLVCAGNEMSGSIGQTETQVGTRYVLNSVLVSPATPGDCALINGKLGTALAVGPEQLAALGVDGATNVRVTFTALTPGQFRIDGFQVIHGNTLTAGVYDSFLPDNLLDFNSSNDDEANRAALGCNPDFLWCTLKVARSFGDTVLSTQDQNASLSFEIEGTGFSVVTNIGVGARMRICYTQTPASGQATFPAESLASTWNNNNQDLSLGGFWCEIVTTNSSTTTTWAVNGDRRFPLRVPQYGFAYYGLPMGRYSVQVLMLDTVAAAAANALQIDAIVVFSDYETLDVMTEGFYDNTEAIVSLEPLTQWISTSVVTRPPRAAYNGTENTTSNAGAIMQMRVDGNAVTLFQTTSTAHSADIRVCVIVTMAVIHCAPASATTAQGVENIPPVAQAPYALAFELANFSQSGRASFFAPIMFYGLGVGDHTIIMENRDHNKKFSFDALLIQE